MTEPDGKITLLLTLPAPRVRRVGAIVSTGSAFGLAATKFQLDADGHYFPALLWLSCVLLPLGLALLAFPSDVDPTTGKRTPKWELGIALSALLGFLAGLWIFYKLGGLTGIGLRP